MRMRLKMRMRRNEDADEGANDGFDLWCVRAGICCQGTLFELADVDEDLKAAFDRDKSGMVRMFWQEQKQALTTADMRSMRWSPQCIRLALAVYIRSKSAYTSLKKTGLIKLPSDRLLRSYESARATGTGVSETNGAWYRAR